MSLTSYNESYKKILKNLFFEVKIKFKIEEEQRQRDEMKEQYFNAEKRVNLLQSEKEELSASLEQVERQRKQGEFDAAEMRDQSNELNLQVSNLNANKRKIEGELQVCC